MLSLIAQRGLKCGSERIWWWWWGLGLDSFLRMPRERGRERQGKYPMMPWVAGAVIIQTKCTDTNSSWKILLLHRNELRGHGTIRDWPSGGREAGDNSGGETLLRSGRDSPAPPRPATPPANQEELSASLPGDIKGNELF